MKPRTKRILLVMCGIFVLGLGGLAWLGYELFSPDSPRNRASAIECTLLWGRLAPFTASAQHQSVTVAGGMFTREFRVSFVAPSADLEQWLQQSPGTREVLSTTPSPGVRLFEITPGGGAQFAEVTIDDMQHRVSIRVYWS